MTGSASISAGGAQARPMNDIPLGYPRMTPGQLGSDAQHLYRIASDRHILDRNVFAAESGGVSYIRPAAARAFRPTRRMIAAITELEDAGLARYSTDHGHQLLVTRVHERYTVAFGRGSQFIRVSTHTDAPEEAQLLAVLVGGDLENRSNSIPGISTVVARSRHENATDDEHDASSTAQLTIRHPGPPVFTGYGGMRFQGVLTEARLYPPGTDPVNRADGLCTLCGTPHPFAPFLPPRLSGDEGPVFVTVETLPIRPYLVAAPPAGWH